jgi:hypothetical protein
MGEPKQYADALFRSARVVEILKQHLPMQCPTFDIKWRAEDPAMRGMRRRDKPLQMVSVDQLVWDRCAREMTVVASQTHLICRIGDPDGLPAIYGIGQGLPLFFSNILRY